MQFNDYLLKRLTGINSSLLTNGLNGATTDNSAVSLFSSINKTDLQNIDLSKVLSSSMTDLAATGEDNAQIIKALFEIQQIQQAADIDGSGDLTAEEAQAYLDGMSGENGEISAEDIDNTISNLGVNLEEAAVAALSEALEITQNATQAPEFADAEEVQTDAVNKDEAEEKTEKTEKKEKAEKTEKTEKPKKTKASSSAGSSQSAGGGGGASSVGGGYSSSPSSSGDVKKEQTTEEKADEIKKKIQDKKADIDKIEADAEKEIKAQEDAKKEAMKKMGVSDKDYEEYKKQEDLIEKDIKDTEKSVSDEEDKIVDYNSSISSNKSYIKSIDAQIKENESAIANLKDSKDDKSTKKDIQSKISNLKTEKEKVEKENQDLETKKKEAETKKRDLKTKITNLENQKKELLNKTLGASAMANTGNINNHFDTSKLTSTGNADDIGKFDEEISKIRSEKEQKVSAAKDEIQKLETKLKNVEQKEARDKKISKNSACQFDFDFTEDLSKYNKEELANLKKIYEKNKEKYKEVEEATGVPAELICAIHYREGSCRFDTYLHNGEKLGKPTTLVPKGICFNDWTEAAIDAIKREHPEKIKKGDFQSCCDFAEGYNGYGYRKHGCKSAYVWSGTTTYTGGMYVADGVFDPNKKDPRIGVAVAMKYLMT